MGEISRRLCLLRKVGAKSFPFLADLKILANVRLHSQRLFPSMIPTRISFNKSLLHGASRIHINVGVRGVVPAFKDMGDESLESMPGLKSTGGRIANRVLLGGVNSHQKVTFDSNVLGEIEHNVNRLVASRNGMDVVARMPIFVTSETENTSWAFLGKEVVRRHLSCRGMPGDGPSIDTLAIWVRHVRHG